MTATMIPSAIPISLPTLVEFFKTKKTKNKKQQTKKQEVLSQSVDIILQPKKYGNLEASFVFISIVFSSFSACHGERLLPNLFPTFLNQTWNLRHAYYLHYSYHYYGFRARKQKQQTQKQQRK